MNYSERFFFFMGHTITCSFIKICCIIPLLEILKSAPFHCANPQLEENTQETTGMFSVNFNKNPTGKWSYHLSLFSTRSGWTLEQAAHTCITWRCSKFSWTRPWATWVIPEVGPALSRPLDQKTSLRVPSNLNYSVIQIKINTLTIKSDKLVHFNCGIK